ncbi:kinase-like domain-containing protein [Rhizophagus clarus]|uniref:Kinase-like domain-containing protein n=1 Tax=Rhizophagus clarus TaxID=94130 RepID=A0A8H3QAM0_9GLOM|nr:kinase-like domain-containing protein [Rhizophagus clarus]
MFNLAICYKNGNGTKKNLEKAFYWYQKAAENSNEEAILDLVDCYENGEGTEKNLKKTFYWHQKVEESNKGSFKDRVGICNECKQPHSDYQWCQQCNSKRFKQHFSKWTSKNEFIDKFIQEAQLNAKNSYEILEWIPYDKLSNINYYNKGGFSKIYKAIWLDGPVDSWDFDRQQWNRWNFQTGYEVVLKMLDNSFSLNSKFLDEWKYSPFNHEAHDIQLSLSICKGERPEIMSNTPKCYADLMEKCWDPDPENRPAIAELEYKISEWIRCINLYYKMNKDGNHRFMVPNINNKLKNDMLDFIKANDFLVQEEANISVLQSHPQAYCISRNLTEISECLDYMI